MSCKYCECDFNDFQSLNSRTEQYSGIEIGLSRLGVLRVRYFEDYDTYISADLIEFKFCPMCGKKFKKMRINKNGEIL